MNQPTHTEDLQKETNDTQAEENNSSKPRSYSQEKMIFLVLLEAAMRYREGYFREEVNQFIEVQQQAFKAYCEKNNVGYSKQQKMLTRMSADNSTFRNEYERFNSMVYAEIKKSVKEEQAKLGTPFDNYASSWGLCAEEFVKAKNTTELLTLMKSYNDGLFDDALNHLKNNTKENARE